MRSTRSSALRCPSCRRNTLTICSRLLDRFPPVGFSRERSSRVVATRGLDAERRSAPARRHRVRVLDGEAPAGNRVDEIHFGALEITDADRIDEQLDAVRLEHLVGSAAAFLDHQAVLEARAAAALHEHTQAAAGLALFSKQLVDLRGCRLGHVDHGLVLQGKSLFRLYAPSQTRASPGVVR